LTATGGGLVITGQTNGDLIALDARTGALLYQRNLGVGAIDGGVVTYEAKGRQLIAVAAGDTNATYKAKGESTIMILGLP
jgi:alcohol dehydrogenase (cytochrome c)